MALRLRESFTHDAIQSHSARPAVVAKQWTLHSLHPLLENDCIQFIWSVKSWELVQCANTSRRPLIRNCAHDEHRAVKDCQKYLAQWICNMSVHDTSNHEVLMKLMTSHNHSEQEACMKQIVRFYRTRSSAGRSPTFLHFSSNKCCQRHKFPVIHDDTHIIFVSLIQTIFVNLNNQDMHANCEWFHKHSNTRCCCCRCTCTVLWMKINCHITAAVASTKYGTQEIQVQQNRLLQSQTRLNRSSDKKKRKMGSWLKMTAWRKRDEIMRRRLRVKHDSEGVACNRKWRHLYDIKMQKNRMNNKNKSTVTMLRMNNNLIHGSKY